MLSVPYPFPHRPNRKQSAKRPLLSVLDVTLFKSEKKRSPEPAAAPAPIPEPAPPPSAPAVVAFARDEAPPPPPPTSGGGGEDAMFLFLKLAVDALVEEKNDAAAVETFCTVYSTLHKRAHIISPRLDAYKELVVDSDPPQPDYEAVQLGEAELTGLCDAIKQEAPESVPSVHPASSDVLQRFFARLEPGSALLALLSDRLGAHAYDVVAECLWKNPPVADAADFAARYTPDWQHVPSLPPFDSPCSNDGSHALVRHGSNSNACASFRAHGRTECTCPRDRCTSCSFETALRDLVARIAATPASAWDCVLSCRDCGGNYCPFSVFTLFEPPPRPLLQPPEDEMIASGVAAATTTTCTCTSTRNYAPPSLSGLGGGECFFDMMLHPKKNSHIKGCPLHSSHKSGKKTGGKVGRPPKIKRDPL